MAKIQPIAAIVAQYDTKSVARISGLTVDMINYLCRHKIVNPSGDKRRGRGTLRVYTFTDILLLRVIAKLLNQGISVLRLKKCLTALQSRGGDAAELVSKKFIATDGYDIYFAESKILEVLASGQMAFAFVLELSNLRKEVLSNISDGQNWLVAK